ncbi:hypothetical protein SLEP1_g27727 [Rubroshorea leprosula]|uniref:Uncharacterized protein n=1 Tax=Rubroshorea leprosula TaxID=152421 RepID=A0AAV5JXT1_9ROSI|nr:hypothetical protein SLEP1_g27727 [Rubroshorea leprosula]
MWIRISYFFLLSFFFSPRVLFFFFFPAAEQRPLSPTATPLGKPVRRLDVILLFLSKNKI